VPFVYMSDLAQAQPQDQQQVQGAAELQALYDALTQLKAGTSADNAVVKTSMEAVDARKQRLIDLVKKLGAAKAQLASMQRTTGVSPPGMGFLAGGAMSWFIGQVQKIDADVKTGRWTDMLVEVIRLTPEAQGKNPEEIIVDPIASAVRNKYLEVYNPQDAPELREIGLTALDSIFKNQPIAWDGQTPAPPPPPPPARSGKMCPGLRKSAAAAQFDASVYAQNFQFWAQYVQTHQPDGNFVKKTIREAGRITSQLDKYVPGWSALIDIVAPSIPILAPVAALVKALPVVGGPAGKIVGNIIGGTPAFGTPSFTSFPGAAAPGLPTVTSAGIPTAAISGPQNIPGFGADVVLKPITDTAVEISRIASPFKFTISKVGVTAATTQGPLLAKIEAASFEALSAASLALALGSAVVTGGASIAAVGSLFTSVGLTTLGTSLAATGAALTVDAATPAVVAAIKVAQLAVDALRTGISLVRTQQAADALRKAADASLRKAQADAALYEQATQQTIAELAKIKLQIEAVQRERDRVLAQRRAEQARKQAELATKTGPVAAVARTVGVSETTVVVAGLAIVGGLILLAAASGGDDEES